MRITSSRTEAGSATYLVESGDKGKVTKIMPADDLIALTDQVENALSTTLTSSKKSGVWFDEVGGDDVMDIRFITLDAHDTGERFWVSHRFICSPKRPIPGSEEDRLLSEVLTIILKHVQMSGVDLNTFMGSLYARFGSNLPGNL